jgi:DNA gyrase inhibitor GyrI
MSCPFRPGIRRIAFSLLMASVLVSAPQRRTEPCRAQTTKPLLAEPRLEHRAAMHYMAIQAAVPMQKLGTVLPKLWPRVKAWLNSHHIAQTDAPFIRYLVVDMPANLVIQAGIPVANVHRGEGQIQPGTLPAGRYAVLTHLGPYSGLLQANADIQAWARAQGIVWKTHKTLAGTDWDGRAEFYVTDPGKQPDPRTWKTEITFLITNKSSQGMSNKISQERADKRSGVVAGRRAG